MHWEKELKKGQDFLAGNDLQEALKCFESAVAECPVSAERDLEISLFFLGFTLRKLGRIESALRCRKLRRKLENINRSSRTGQKTNSYGMDLSDTSCEDEDRAAFISLQLERYLETKRNKRFCSDAERDVIYDILSTYWSESLSNGEIDHMTTDEKILFFKQQLVIFPVADINRLSRGSSGVVIYANFRNGVRQSMDEECLCGSGLLFSQCCGRMKSPQEVAFGEK